MRRLLTYFNAAAAAAATAAVTGSRADKAKVCTCALDAIYCRPDRQTDSREPREVCRPSAHILCGRPPYLLN